MATILIVDDSITFREILKHILTEGGHTVVGEASNGADGARLYKELRPDVISLDLNMPVLDGLGALREIMDFDPEAKVVIASSSAQNEKMVEAMMLGAAEFLAKPFEIKAVTDVVAKLTE